MDINRMVDTVQRLSDDHLKMAMRGGAIPTFVVASEIQRRKDLRERNATQPSTLAEDLEESYASGGFLTQNRVDPHYAHGKMGEADFFGQGALGAPRPIDLTMNAAPNGVVIAPVGSGVYGAPEGSNEAGEQVTGGIPSTGDLRSDIAGFLSEAGRPALGVGMGLMGGPLGAGIMAGGLLASGLSKTMNPDARATPGITGLVNLARDAYTAMSGGFQSPAQTHAQTHFANVENNSDWGMTSPHTDTHQAQVADAVAGWGGDGGSKDSTSGDPGGASTSNDGSKGDFSAGGAVLRAATWPFRSRAGRVAGLGALGGAGYYFWPREEELPVPPIPPEEPAPQDRPTAARSGGGGGMTMPEPPPAPPTATRTSEKVVAQQEEPRGMSPLQLALIQAGLGMMSSTARTPLAALGEAGVPAVATYMRATQTENEDRRRRSQEQIAAQRHNEMMQRYDLDREARLQIAGMTDARQRQLAAARGAGRAPRPRQPTATDINAVLRERNIDPQSATLQERAAAAEVVRRFHANPQGAPPAPQE